MSSTNENFYKIVYFSSIAGVSILCGFGATLGKFKKDSPGVSIQEEGVALARKALFRATVYSVCGFGVFAFGAYHLFGKQLIERTKARINTDPIEIPEEFR